SVLPAMSKLFEKILLSRLQQLALIGNWVHPNQHGFQANCSTESALHCLVNEVETGFQKKNVTACALIDIKSAFDTAWAPAILLALIKRQCPLSLVKIVKDFLSHR
ncbi:putative Histone H1, partial [Daphnia magna]